MHSDKFREECGIVGVWDHPEASNLAYLGLYALQHRGQEGAGVVSLADDLEASSDGQPSYHVHKGLGLVADIFKSFDFAKNLPGRCAIGHVRYSTTGENRIANVQPMYAEVAGGRLAIAHNGNLVNASPLRRKLIKSGAIFSSTSDTEVIVHLVAKAGKSTPAVENLISALKQVRGAYSLVAMYRNSLYAVRDPNGFRPLCMGRMPGGAVVFASETCAFDLLGAQFERELDPGELVEVSASNNVQSFFPFGRSTPTPCIFEYVYFARPDSTVFGRNVYAVRKEMGAELARECKVKADVVVPVPDSGVTAAIGYAQETGLPLEMGLIRNHYVGRTFIEPQQSIRDFGVKIKLNANPHALQGKVVVAIDDSIVRGTTSRKLVKMLRGAGAKEVHFRVSAPPTTGPCYYGIDTPEKHQLIAAKMSVDEIREFLAADSLQYLSIEGLYRAVDSKRGSFCDACFSGKYPLGTAKNGEAPEPQLKLV